MTISFEGKVAALRRRLRELESAVVAFSGGVDSSVLVKLAHEELGPRMIAVTAISPGMPDSDRSLASSLCATHGIPHSLIETDEFDDPIFTSNPSDRCYYCKKHLYGALVSVADEKFFKYVVEGTNASDLGGHRPGYRASCENARVATPLIDAGFIKEDVRRLAKELDLFTADKPSAACLASRIPTGTRLEPELMKRIDSAEDILRKIGVGQVRVRHHGDSARIEVDSKDLGLCLEHRGEILDKLGKLGWKIVSLDLRGYE